MSLQAVAIDSIPDLRHVVATLMAADGHGLPSPPTHAFLIDNEVVGAMSTLDLPVLWFWMSTHTKAPLASYRAYTAAESVAVAMGHKRIVLPIEPQSPFYPFVTRMGFTLIAPCELFHKSL